MLDFLPESTFPIPIIALRRVIVHPDYDEMDRMAGSAGFYVPETAQDERVPWVSNVGAQNNNLHSGWIATMGDESHSVEQQVKLLNEKVAILKKRGINALVGFAQTGMFAVGYSIYERGRRQSQISSR